MSHRRTEQERKRIRKEKKDRKKAAKAAQQAVADARAAARCRIDGLDSSELEEEQEKCLEAWLEHMSSESGTVLYGNPFTGTFSSKKPERTLWPADWSKLFKKTFPFLSDFKGHIKFFAVDDKGTPLVNGLPPEESHIDEKSWRRFLVEETFTVMNYYRTSSFEALFKGSDSPLAVQMRDLQKRASYDQKGKLSYVWLPCDEKILAASSGELHLYQKLMEMHYGKDLRLTNVQQAASKDGVDMVFLESITHEAMCPFCGSMSRTKRSTYKREMEDLPLRPGVRKRIKVKGNVYYCAQCAENGISDKGEKVKGYFRERLEIARVDSRRTNRLDAWILMLVSNGSFHNAERDLRRIGCEVGDDAIRRLVMSLRFDDIPDITAIGVDDVSLRKGQSYATVIYSLADHRLLCVLPGRDGKALRKWLDDHPCVRKIARDRGTAYAKTIDAWARDNGIEDEVVQVADRFHLIKNFVDHVKDHAYHYLPKHIAIDRNTEKLMDTVPSKVAVARDKTKRPSEELMSYWNYTNDPVCDENGQPIEIILPPTGQDASDDSAMTPAQKKKEENRAAKYDTYKSMREEYKAAPKYWGQYKELADKYEVTNGTVKKYCTMTDEEFEACWGPERTRERRRRSREIDNYVNMMYKMFTAGLDIGKVFWYVRYKGFSQSDSTLVHYVIEMYKQVFPTVPAPSLSDYLTVEYPANVHVVTRSNIVKYFLTVNPKTAKDPLLVKCEEEILKKYPNIKMLRDYFIAYHSAVMGDDPEAIESFADDCRLPEFKGFHDTLKKDMKAVQAAVLYPESSGLVEGGNNKYKTILKIHYGRLKLETLNQVCVFSSWHARQDFELSDVLWWYDA